MTRNDFDLLTDPIPGLLRRLAVPVGIGFFFNTMFNVVDTFYGGLISTVALAAMSLSFPVFFLIIAIGSGISTGATALIGHALGAGEQEEARLLAAQTITFGLLHGILLSVGGLAVAPTIFRLMGATGEYLALALAYMNAIFSGASCFVLNQSLNAILNATGDTRNFRNFLVVGFFFNLLLDPWFMFGGFGLPPMGLAGVAWATVVIQFMGNFYLLYRTVRNGLLDRRSWPLLVPRPHTFRALFRQGFPASLSMLTVALGIFVITWFVGRFGKEFVFGGVPGGGLVAGLVDGVKGGDFEQEFAAGFEGGAGFTQNQAGVGGTEDVEFAINEHGQVVAGAEIGLAQVREGVGAVGRGMLEGVLD